MRSLKSRAVSLPGFWIVEPATRGSLGIVFETGSNGAEPKRLQRFTQG